MSDTYSYGGGGPGGTQRDRIAQALMAISNPPPGGLPPGGTSPQGVSGLRPTRPGAAQGLLGGAHLGNPAGGLLGGGAPMTLPQQQPVALGAQGAPAGPLGPLGGPYDPNLGGLPGVAAPGQLPPGMRPGAGAIPGTGTGY
jgi:hypothetical protein